MIAAKVDGDVVMLCDFGTGKEAMQQAKGHKAAPVRQAGSIVNANFWRKRTFKKAVPIAKIEIDMVFRQVDMAKQI